MHDVTSGDLSLPGRHRLTAPGRTSSRFTLVASALLTTAPLVQAVSLLHDGPLTSPVWLPQSWEVTSMAGFLAALWIVPRANRAAGGIRSWPRRLLALLAAATVFSGLHCLVMWTARRAVYTAIGHPYGWSISAAQIFYEYHKDLLTFGILAGLHWGMEQLTQREAGHPSAGGDVRGSMPIETPRPHASDTLDIRDGTRLFRARVADIVAAEAAGNYVSVHLNDGSTKLMRTTLSGLLDVLAQHGFVRVHRGWLVNPDRVQAMEPTGAGDWRLVLTNKLLIPMSRRYPASVQEMRRRSGL